MITGREYKKSLADGRAIFFEGERVEDLPGHPVLGTAVDVVADCYDLLYSADPNQRSPLMTIPRSAADLKARIPILHDADLLAHVTYQSCMTIITAAGRMPDLVQYGERIRKFVDHVQANDLRVTECITDAKGDRSLSPGKQPDADAYTHVVERRDGGVVIRGAKLHISGASLGHELLVIPTKAMKPGEEDYAIACAVPVNADGVKIVNASYAPRHDDPRAFPISAHKHCPEGFVIFDDVFVPEERIFLDGEVANASVFAHSLGLWERLGSLSFLADDADELVGFAQLIAEANGLARVGHVREKISDMIIHATLIRASLEAAIFNCSFGPGGEAFPNELYTNAGKYHGAANYNQIVRHLHDIGGGSTVTAPSIADLENNEVGALVRKYMSAAEGAAGEYRMRLFHAIRDLTADSFGGWKFVTNLQAGGGLYAQRIVTRKHYDMEHAKAKALKAAGLKGPDAAE
ncbi:MAG: 4-hydroxyphenylacetate 3-hydroxylase N-terminal domain-containing protein [Alphaproteobacteria bacterium]|jgi:4-hydroxybutyryl-CoA dehydratase/vinylacetyl-CoA-Delta-isomerase|nr:4-hydroxyphenylacetate 3-hydroxylase N-terminal domain-containing protein [Alphaproteobacteria bacterium]MDP6515428.1 4-hydroxyphenylacetate 3-hydroxylase N-terminal domain-containing protein [Alphaproteobacteria bacterium]|tara:strand:+ start:580 stop:1968 length:1389 start_codon:yes stop_codon:yes gene_type:complete